MNRARRCFAILFVVLTTLSLVSCGNEDGILPQPAPAGFLRMVNAVPDAPTLRFIVDERPEGTLGFGEASRFTETLPDIPITVRVVYFQDNRQVNLITTQITVLQDHDFTLVAAGTLENPRLIEIDNPPLSFEDGTDQAEMQLVNAASLAPAELEVTIDENGATSQRTIQFGETTDLESLTADISREFSVRQVGSQTAEWRSGAFSFAPTTRRLLVIFDYFGPGDGSVRILRVGEAGALPFPEEALPSAIRVANMTADRGPLNVNVAGNSLAENLAFGDVSDYVQSTTGEVTVQVTPFGEPDNIIAEAAFQAPPGQFRTLMLTGPADAVQASMNTDNRRRIPILFQLTVGHGSPSANAGSEPGSLDVYLLESGESVSDQSANGRLGFQETASLFLPAGTLDLVLTEAGTKEIVFGPQRLDLTNNGIFRIFITDTAGGGLPVQIVRADDFVD